ncbi:MAG: AAA family ATPase [Nostoc sp. DedQUE12a]|nr:AAA family ATPase [Nostoc sp. DedQUE12a]
MEGKRFIHSIRLENFLSYGNEGEEIQLQPLNVLIGSNASGKSNLIEAIGLLQATPGNLTAPIREGGGVREWLWKGATGIPTAEIEAVIDYPQGIMPLRYKLGFTMVNQRLEIVDEAIENQNANYDGAEDVYFFYRYQNGRPVLNVRTTPEGQAGTSTGRSSRRLRQEELSPNQSVLSQKKDLDSYPELTYLGNQFSKIRIYREWNIGRYTPPRMAQPADLPNDFLDEDARNLGHVLNNLDYQGEKPKLLKQLQKFYDAIDDITIRVESATVQVFLREQKLGLAVPATRLSDGTLRYLCLLTILSHPSPPPLVCIEEPEVGLHPDILPTIAELLIQASKRTQLVVTTHSDSLVSGLSEYPESVIVCERDQKGSHLHRQEPKRLEKWLEKYSLGDLWRMGQIGGNRW